MGGFARVLLWGGISTVVWGVLIGTFFGVDFDVIFGTVNKFPLILDPMTDPIGMLIICFGLGFLHIMFGLFLKMKIAFSRGDWRTALYDTLSWMFVLIGLVVFGVSSAVSGVPAILGKVGMYMALLGAVVILIFKGRESKNPVGRTAQGLFELYQISGYLSDILSYSRLFALGISTGVIATVFNQLCGMLMVSENIFLRILGTVIAVALLIVLQGFGIAINTLGAFVHTARLQYVEFYGKFYEPGGRTFQPLGYRTKHVRITDETSVTE
jgi:V/A-type H+-transporting ATPase subunit I